MAKVIFRRVSVSNSNIFTGTANSITRAVRSNTDNGIKYINDYLVNYLDILGNSQTYAVENTTLDVSGDTFTFTTGAQPVGGNSLNANYYSCDTTDPESEVGSDATSGGVRIGRLSSRPVKNQNSYIGYNRVSSQYYVEVTSQASSSNTQCIFSIDPTALTTAINSSY